MNAAILSLGLLLVVVCKGLGFSGSTLATNHDDNGNDKLSIYTCIQSHICESGQKLPS